MTSELPPPDPEAVPHGTGRERSPNYTARRVAVGSALVAVVAIAAVVVLRIAGGSGSEQDTSVEPGWSHLVEIDRSSGDIVVIDADGEEIDSLDGDGRAADVHVRNGRIALVGSGRIVLRDLGGGGDPDADTDRAVVEIDTGTTVTRHPTNRSFTLVVSPDVGGEIVVVDAEAGTATALGARAGQSSPLLLPETLRVNRDGTRVAVGDGRNFQTILIDTDPEIEPGFFPGVPMAVSDDLVITSTNVGRTAELGFFDTDGERLGLVPSDRPVSGILDDDRFVYVTEQGGLFAVSADDSSPEELAQLPTGVVSTVRPVLDQTRFVVSGSTRTVVVELDGSVIVETDQEFPEAWDTWRCLALTGDEPGVIDLRSGDVVAELDPLPIEAVSTDGCGVHQRDEGDHVISSPAGTFTPRGSVRSVVLAPDGSAAVVVATDGTAELVTLDDSRRLDLGTRRGVLTFTEL